MPCICRASADRLFERREQAAQDGDLLLFRTGAGKHAPQALDQALRAGRIEETRW
jgi:hypothetical protein